MAWSRVISRPGSSRSRGDSANKNNLVMRKARRQGGLGRNFWPGNLAFPPIFAPRAPHPPPCSPSGNSAAARRRRCGGGGRGEMLQGNRAGPHHLLHTHTHTAGSLPPPPPPKDNAFRGARGPRPVRPCFAFFRVRERTLFTVHMVQFTPLLYTAAAGTPAGRSRFYATLGGGPPDAPPLLPARLPAWRGSSPPLSASLASAQPTPRRSASARPPTPAIYRFTILL